MINWGIIGLGKMGNQFAQAITKNKECNLLAISSKSEKKIKEFSQKYKIENKNQFLIYTENLFFLTFLMSVAELLKQLASMGISYLMVVIF